MLGACAGGLTTGLMLDHLSHRGEQRANAATVMTSMLETSYPNILAMPLLEVGQAVERLLVGVSVLPPA